MTASAVLEDRRQYRVGDGTVGDPTPDQIERSIAIAHAPARVRQDLARHMGLSSAAYRTGRDLARELEARGLQGEFTSWWRVCLSSWATAPGQSRRALEALAVLPGGLFPPEMELDPMPDEMRSLLIRLLDTTKSTLITPATRRRHVSLSDVELSFVEILLRVLGWHLPDRDEVRRLRTARSSGRRYEVRLFGRPALAVMARRPRAAISARTISDRLGEAERAGFPWVLSTDATSIQLYFTAVRGAPAWSIDLPAEDVGLPRRDVDVLYQLSRDSVEHRRLESAWWATHRTLLARIAK